MTDPSRRRVLGAVGGGLLGALAGCANDGPTASSGGPGGRGTAGDWPLVGRTPTNRLFDDDGVAVTGGVDVAWTYEYDVPDGADAPRLSYSGPVVVDGVVYAAVTGRYTSPTDGTVHVNEVVGVDAGTGDPVSRLPFLEDEETHWSGSFSPVVADGRLYLAGVGVFAFDLESGDRPWRAPDPVATGQATAVEDDVFVPVLGDGETTTLAAFDATDGTERWRADHPAPPDPQPPTVTAETVYVTAGPEVVAFDRAEGTERWRTNAGVESHVYAPGRENATPVTPPVVGEDVLYVAGGLEAVTRGDAGALAALDPETGEVRWSFRPEPSGSDRWSLVGGMPALHDGTLYVTGAPDVEARRGPPRETVLYAVDAADGSLRWQTPTQGLAVYVVGAGDSVVVVSTAGVSTYAAADGTRRGRLTADDGGPDVAAANPVSDGRVFTRGARGLVAYAFG